LDEWKKIEVFPEVFPEPKVGKLHLERALDLDDGTLRRFIDGGEDVHQLFDAGKKYDFFAQRDVIPVANDTQDNPKPYAQITYRERITLKDYLHKIGDKGYWKEEIERRAGRKLRSGETITILEFRKVYQWKFDPDRKLNLG
jgi:hypothetical protein